VLKKRIQKNKQSACHCAKEQTEKGAAKAAPQREDVVSRAFVFNFINLYVKG